VHQPRLVSLDTASWGRIAHNKTAASAKRIFKLFDSGAIIPFFTSSHFEELARHKNDSVFRDRVALIRSLPFVRYPKLRESPMHIGDTLEAREYEMAVLVHYPAASHEFIIEQSRADITNGFCSGLELCKANLKWWSYYRAHFADYMLAHAAEIASLCHFPDPNLSSDAPLPKSSRNLQLRPKEEVLELVTKRFGTLAAQLKKFGDERLRDPERRLTSPEQMSGSFLAEVYRGMLPLYEMDGDFLENLLSSMGIDRDRLPADATVDDAGYEVVFTECFRVHERRLNLPSGALRQIARQELVPSWIVWREVNRSIKKLEKAEGSSITDSLIVPFSLYLDAVEVDKRIWHCLQDAAHRHPLLRRAQRQTFRSGSLSDLADDLEKIAERPRKASDAATPELARK
jgi:hypothetical protein